MEFPSAAKVMVFIVTRDRANAVAFYRTVLGFTLDYEDNFAAVLNINGTMLRISAVEDHVAQQHTVLGWEVPDIADAVTSLRERGVVFRIYPGFGQDKLGIWAAPGNTAKIAWFTDPDGNVLSLTQL